MTLLDLFRIVSSEARSDEEVVAVVSDLINRRCVRLGGAFLDESVQVV